MTGKGLGSFGLGIGDGIGLGSSSIIICGLKGKIFGDSDLGVSGFGDSDLGVSGFGDSDLGVSGFGDSDFGDGVFDFGFGAGFFVDKFLNGEVKINLFGFSRLIDVLNGEVVVYLLTSVDYFIGVGLILTYSI